MGISYTSGESDTAQSLWHHIGRFTRSGSFYVADLQLSYKLAERLYTGPSDSGNGHAFPNKGKHPTAESTNPKNEALA